MEIAQIDIEKNKEGVKEFATELKNKLEEHFSSLSQPILKNITEVVIALLLVLRTPRGWYGRLTLSGVARCMKTAGGFKARYKRLDRFLRNKRFEPEQTISGLLNLTYGEGSDQLLPTLIDQSAIRDVQVIAASFPYQGRAIPVAMETFEYEKIKVSQKTVEEDFFRRLQEKIGKKHRLLYITDRGYADVKYICHFNKQGQLYIIRGCSNVIIEYNNDRGKRRRTGVGRLPHRQGKPRRYRNVIYHDKERVLVDIIVYRGKGFKEPWFLIVPPDSEDILPTEQVVEWYAMG